MGQGPLGLVEDGEESVVAGSRCDVDKDVVQLRAAFRHLTDLEPAYWSFEEIKYNENPLSYFQYPAMMVPRMQGAIIDTLQKEDPTLRWTLDPFAGSGTVLVESLKRGLSSVAADINPMAILLCLVKSQPFRVEAVEDALRDVEDAVAQDRLDSVAIEYSNRQKWFTPNALVALSRWHRAIARIEALDVRRFLWVGFGEAVRIACNSRTSTYKLHIRPTDEIQARDKEVKQRIADAMRRAVVMYRRNYETFSEGGLLEEGAFPGEAVTKRHDMRNPLDMHLCDALISSPPYGDNHTTITYGQHSFLPLQWIPLEDIDPALDASVVTTTHTLDSMSLGGALAGASSKEQAIAGKSERLAEFLSNPGMAREARVKVAAFFHDLDLSLDNALCLLKPQAPIVLTLGNRCVGGRRVPTDLIVKELLEAKSCVFVDTHCRAIPTKRMAHRNKNAETMLTETMLVMRGPA